jgi:Holliday junction resolvasome RuvABC endonuclease subunit
VNILGLDISTSMIGIAVIDDKYKLKTYDKIKFKTDMPLEERVDFLVNKLHHLDKYYNLSAVYIEQPAMMFGRGKTTAQTMSKLQRFNGMCSYAVYNELQIIPSLIHPSSARKKMNISIPRSVSNKKHFIIERVKEKYPKFTFNLTRYGNPQPGTDDIADAIVVAYAGVRTTLEGENAESKGESSK